MTTPPPLHALYGCLEHRVGTKDVNDRWANPAVDDAPLLAMCECCGGPMVLDRFDGLGIGYGSGRCSKCGEKG